MNSELIRGKVARILNSRELVLNRGVSSGVAVGMYFNILDPKGEDIDDPDTGEIIGSLERPKVMVKIISVEEHLSVAATFKKKKINVGGSGSSSIFRDLSLSRALMPPQWVTKYETLKTDEKTWEDLSESESYVKTGDPAIQVHYDEEDL